MCTSNVRRFQSAAQIFSEHKNFWVERCNLLPNVLTEYKSRYILLQEVLSTFVLYFNILDLKDIQQKLQNYIWPYCLSYTNIPQTYIFLYQLPSLTEKGKFMRSLCCLCVHICPTLKLLNKFCNLTICSMNIITAKIKGYGCRSWNRNQ